jgi:CHAT domain-containing protein
MGGVQYNTDKTKKEIWNYLPGTLNETDNIQSFLEKKKHSVNLFAANDANETNFKKQAQKANVLHISTHGFFFPDPEQVREEVKKNEVNEENIIFRGTEALDSAERGSSLYANWSFVINKNPLMRSGLVLAGANDVWQRNALEEGEDGILTAQEVSNLDLRNTKLVVLSACETGLGDIKGSEGVFGLQRAFKMAGAEYLIMSLWQVPDKETAEFMELFYKNLVKVKDIPKAFNVTQQVMRKKYDPYYWAAFILIN